MSIGFKIKKLREEQNLSQETLAFKLGVSQSKLSDIENGQRKKEIDFLLMDKICKTFNKDLDYFMAEKTINNIHENKGQVSCNVVTINNYPHNILEQVQQLINDTLAKEQRIKELEIQLHIKNS